MSTATSKILIAIDGSGSYVNSPGDYTRPVYRHFVADVAEWVLRISPGSLRRAIDVGATPGPRLLYTGPFLEEGEPYAGCGSLNPPAGCGVTSSRKCRGLSTPGASPVFSTMALTRAGSGAGAGSGPLSCGAPARPRQSRAPACLERRHPVGGQRPAAPAAPGPPAPRAGGCGRRLAHCCTRRGTPVRPRTARPGAGASGHRRVRGCRRQDHHAQLRPQELQARRRAAGAAASAPGWHSRSQPVVPFARSKRRCS